MGTLTASDAEVVALYRECQIRKRGVVDAYDGVRAAIKRPDPHMKQRHER